MRPHILICSVNFDARPEGICTGRLVRALLDQDVRVTLICAREKSRLGFAHPLLDVRALSTGLRHPQWLWHALARARGELPSNHYGWTRRAASIELDELPDVIYGRAWPFSSLVAAQMLAQRLKRPLWLHFSDPFPPPPSTREAAYVMHGLQQLAAQARGATFTNAHAARYQLRQLGLNTPAWAQVLNHVAPQAQQFGPPVIEQNIAARFVYLGSFHATRPAQPLLAGFAAYLRTGVQAHLHFVGTRRDQVQPDIQHHGVQARVSVEPYTQDVPGWQARASVLLAVDWLHGEPVYLLTKVVEALVVDRPLLLITQPGSPGDRLASQCPDTVVSVTSSEPAAVAQGMARAQAMSARPGDYARRRALMQEFAAPEVARRCIQLLFDGPSP